MPPGSLRCHSCHPPPQNSTLVQNDDGCDYGEIGMDKPETGYEQTRIHEIRKSSEALYSGNTKSSTRAGVTMRGVTDKTIDGLVRKNLAKLLNEPSKLEANKVMMETILVFHGSTFTCQWVLEDSGNTASQQI